MLRRSGRDWHGGGRTYPGHSGTDFLLAPGTPVLAMAAGRITRVHTDLRGGRTIFLDHGAGVATSYRHLQEIIGGPGRRAGRGEAIGVSGRTGVIRLTAGLVPPHLHVTLWVAGLPSDPYRDVSDPGSVSWWVEDNRPRTPRSADNRWDCPPDFRLQQRDTLLREARRCHPVAWRNFHRHCRRLLPARLSGPGDALALPRLTLPFDQFSEEVPCP
jgi:murein DD-endopeptidase MepM/ murein hydrolase activator NlpD